MDKIAIVMPVHNRKTLTMNCVKHLQNISQEGFETEIVVVDDGSTDGTAEAISEAYPDVTILKGDGNLWWAGGVNLGFEYALTNDFNFVYTLNDDAEFFPKTLQILYETLKNRRNAVCSSMFLDFKRRNFVVYTGVKATGFRGKGRSLMRGKLDSSFNGKILEADTLSTKSTLIPTEIIRDVGYFDTKHFPHNYSDFDYFARVKAKGYSVLCNTDSRIYTRGSDTNFHHLILNWGLKDIFKSFFNTKYSNHLKTMYYRATLRRGFIKGHILFIYNFFPYTFWILLRFLLPKKMLYKIFVRTGRIRDDLSDESFAGRINLPQK